VIVVPVVVNIVCVPVIEVDVLGFVVASVLVTVDSSFDSSVVKAVLVSICKRNSPCQS
jgi:hypothetical protein